MRYPTFLASLAKESGIETPTHEDLVKLDKNRKNKVHNPGFGVPLDRNRPLQPEYMKANNTIAEMICDACNVYILWYRLYR